MCDASPIMIERHCGGWLALSPLCEPIKIGVTALTRDEAVAQLRASLARWRETLKGPDLAKEQDAK